MNVQKSIFSPICKTKCFRGNGNCTDLGEGEFRCDCFPGYTAVNCEDDIDECKVSCGTFSLVVLWNMLNIFVDWGGDNCVQIRIHMNLRHKKYKLGV